MDENNEMLSTEEYRKLIIETSEGIIRLRDDSIDLDGKIEDRNNELKEQYGNLSNVKNLVIQKRSDIRKNRKCIYRINRSLSRQNKYMKAVTKAYSKSKLLNARKYLRKQEFALLGNEIRTLIESYFVDKKRIEVTEENYTTLILAIADVVTKLKINSKKKKEILNELQKELINLIKEQKSCENKIFDINQELTSLNREQRSTQEEIRLKSAEMANATSKFYKINA